jgi:hypothetical protein
MAWMTWNIPCLEPYAHVESILAKAFPCAPGSESRVWSKLRDSERVVDVKNKENIEHICGANYSDLILIMVHEGIHPQMALNLVSEIL